MDVMPRIRSADPRDVPPNLRITGLFACFTLLSGLSWRPM
jgi:hypothetical protein